MSVATMNLKPLRQRSLRELFESDDHYGEYARQHFSHLAYGEELDSPILNTHLLPRLFWELENLL